MANTHTFHIPVMGIGFTLDTPLKVAHLGIDSVISLVDDILIEKLRKTYCIKFNMLYTEITDKVDDFRAKRITSYLNLIHKLVEKKAEELRNITIKNRLDLKQYFEMMPDTSSLKKEFKNLTRNRFNINEVKDWLKDNLSIGSIDVNIMTKIDKDNYLKKVKLPVEYNDAHAALRGYANSDLNSSLILSAGMNPRLYSYLEQFKDFYPDENGTIKKKIVLKVSDYRSALIQGKFLAKKGLWVSEYRIESGLNCGGHAFATEGYLIGPILDQFKNKRHELVQSVHEIFATVLTNKKRIVPEKALPLKITAQGGVGTSEEHQFLIDHYKLDSVGWGTPFLLVPEVTTVDEVTLEKLIDAKEEDLYLSNISPLGVPFNTLKGNTKDIEKSTMIAKRRPGSSCPKKYVALNNEFTEKTICIASRQYQHLKIKELNKEVLPVVEYKKRYKKIVDKSCICVGLGTATLLVNNLDTKAEGKGVAICPGPNLAYFSKIMSLHDIVNHIYGNSNMITRNDRPNMFIKELFIYMDFLKNKIDEERISISRKQQKRLFTFIHNLKEGVYYYQTLFNETKSLFKEAKSNILHELAATDKQLDFLELEIEALLVV